MRYILILFILINSLLAQELRHCGSDEMRFNSLKNNPDLLHAVSKRDAELNDFTKQYELKHAAERSSTIMYTIPVVFHVIHNYGIENISDAQILDGLTILNKYYQKLMADTSQIVPAFKSIHADCNIEFKLASIDPNGNCTRGINRIQSNYTYTGTHDVKSLIHWDPAKYLNIYIVNNAADLAGHCVWPADADTIPAWDGIVISHNYVGSIGTSNSTQQVTLSHEVGHYFNLQHTWGGNNVPGYYFLPCGDPNKDCNIDDGVADTPTTIGWASCNLNGASCGSTLDNVQNFMEYSFCNKMFTYGQRTRMHACLNSTIANRNNLWSPANLIATGVASSPGLCAADFKINKMYACVGDSILVSDDSYNGTITSYGWQCAGAIITNSTSQNTYMKFTSPGAYSITHTVSDGTNSKTITKSNVVVVTNNISYNLPFTESFETRTTLPDNDWVVINTDSLKTFELNTNSGFNNTKCAWVDNFNNTTKRREELISPSINYPGASNLTIIFKYAYAQRVSANADKLQVWISKDCGKNWTLRFNKNGTALANGLTSPLQGSPFVPNNVEWNSFTITNISTSFASSDFKVKFLFESDGGNNIYIDDINIDLLSGIEDFANTNNAFTVFPNPTNSTLNITPIENTNEEVQVELYDVNAQLILTKSSTTNQTERIDLSSIAEGIYFLLVRKEHSIVYKDKIIVTKN